MKNIKNYKTLILLGIFLTAGGVYASENNGTIGELFDYIGDQWYLDGENIQTGTVGNNQIGNDAITSEKIGDGEVKTSDILNGSITTQKLGNNSVTSEKIGDGEVKTSDILNGSITTQKLRNNSVTSEKIGAGEVKTSDIGNNSVTQDKVSGGYVDLDSNQTIGGVKNFNGDINGVNINLSDTLNSEEINGVKGNISTINSQNINNSASINSNTINTLSITGSGGNFNGINTNELNSTRINTLELNTNSLNIEEELGVGGNISTTGSLNIKGYSDVGGDSYVGQNLTVSGSTILGNNVDVGGNLVIGGNLGFSDPANVPWMDKNINLPFTKLGTTDFYLPTDVKGDFKGQVLPVWTWLNPYIMRETNGTYVGLREGYDGETRRLFYMYNFLGDLSNLNLTDIEYRPRFIDTLFDSSWNAVTITNGKNNWHIVKITNGSEKKYFMVNHGGTLNPELHTQSNSVEVTSLVSDWGGIYPGEVSDLNNLTYVPEEDIFLRLRGHARDGMYLEAFKNDSGFTKINLKNNRTGQVSDSNLVFDVHPDAGFVNWIQGYESFSDIQNGHVTQNINYEYRNGKINIHSYAGIRLENSGLGLGYDFSTFNLILELDPNNYEIDYNNYLSNNSSEKVDLDIYKTVNGSSNIDYFNENGFLIRHWSDIHSVRPTRYYHIPGTNKILVNENNNRGGTYFVFEEYEADGVIDFVTSYRGKKRGQSELSEMRKLRKTYRPYDASILGKTVQYTRFLSDNKLYTYSLSNIYSPGSGDNSSYNHVLLNLPNTNFTRELDGKNLMTESNGLDVVSNDITKIHGIKLLSNGNMIGISNSNSKAEIYNNIDSSVDLTNTKNYPDGMMNNIRSQICSNNNKYLMDDMKSIADSDSDIDFYCEVKLLQYLDDGIVGVQYGARLWDSSERKRRSKANYAIFEYDNSSLNNVGVVNVGSKSWTSWGAGNLNVYRPTREYGLYKNSSGIIYAVIQPLSYGGGAKPDIIKYDTNSKTLSSKNISIGGNPNYELLNQRNMSIHPKFGPYASRVEDGATRALFCYIDNTSITNLDTRITQIFEGFLNGTKNFDCNNYSTTVQQPQGFILYSGESEIFLNGTYTKIGTKQYDLSDPEYGLVPIGASDSQARNLLSNKTIYAYIDEFVTGTLAEFRFGFEESTTKPTLMIIKTHDDGISTITTIEGLNITGDEVIVNRLKVMDRIEIMGPNGEYYIDFDSNGNMITGEVNSN